MYIIIINEIGNDLDKTIGKTRPSPMDYLS